MSEAATLAQERDTANRLIKDQVTARTKERTTAANNQSALEKVLNNLGKLGLAEERFLQVDRSITPGCASTAAIDGDHEQRDTVAVLAEGPIAV